MVFSWWMAPDGSVTSEAASAFRQRLVARQRGTPADAVLPRRSSGPTAADRSTPIDSPMLFRAGSCSAMPRMLSITCVIGASLRAVAAGPPLPPPAWLRAAEAA